MYAHFLTITVELLNFVDPVMKVLLVDCENRTRTQIQYASTSSDNRKSTESHTKEKIGRIFPGTDKARHNSQRELLTLDLAVKH